MRDALLIFWVATMGADRIDLLGGRGPITLPPYLVLMPLVVLLEVPALMSMRHVEFRREGQVYLLLATILGSMAMASAVGSSEPGLSAKRASLLVFQLYALLFVAVVLKNRPDAGSILVRGAWLGLSISFVFNVLQVAVWLNNPSAPPGGVIDLVPGQFGSLMPRPGGQTLDPNRGGMVFVVFLFILYRFGRPSRARRWATFGTVLSLIITLSRSAALGAMGTLGTVLMERRRLRITPGRVAGFLTAATVGTLAIVIIPGASELMGILLAPITERFSVNDSGNSLHFQLIERALEVAGRSWKNSLFGIGYGNSPTVLTDLLPGTRYANFHSLYATLLAEMGIIALMAGLAMMLYPAVRKNPFRPVAVGFLFFNVFYQLVSEPSFWLVLSCAWVGVGADAPKPAPGPRGAPPLARANAGAS
ncbi:MAG TPA: O-antigen ligase family protein [Longimicrobium sp.]